VRAAPLPASGARHRAVVTVPDQSQGPPRWKIRDTCPKIPNDYLAYPLSNDKTHLGAASMSYGQLASRNHRKSELARQAYRGTTRPPAQLPTLGA